MQRNSLGLRGGMEALAQGGVIGIGHGHEILVTMLADERVHAGVIDVVGDQHDGTWAHVRLEATCRIGEDQGLDPHSFERLDRGTHDGGVAGFIRVRAARQHGHLLPAELPHEELTRMARNLRHREARKIRIRNDERVFHRFRQRHYNLQNQRLRQHILRMFQ